MANPSLTDRFFMVLSFSLTVTRRLWNYNIQEVDIESQRATTSHGSQDMDSSHPRILDAKHSKQIALPMNTSVSSGTYHSTLYTDPEERDPNSERLRYADDPSRVIKYNGDSGKSELALLVTEAMVSKVQKVICSRHKLQESERQYEKLEKNVSTARNMLDNAWDNLPFAEDPESSRNHQQEIERLESILGDACQRRDELQSQLGILCINLNFAQDASHGVFRNVLDQAGLLTLPEAQRPNSTSLASEHDSRADSSYTVLPSQEELLGRTTYENLLTLSRDLADAHRQFDDRPAKYEREEAEYEMYLNSGEEVPSKSEFDRIFLHNGMRLTRYIIDAEAAYDIEREKAVALGMIASDWGTPSEYGSSAAESSPEGELTRASGLSYTRIEAWVDVVSNGIDIDHCDVGLFEMPSDLSGNDGAARTEHVLRFQQTESGSVQIDSWDARAVEISDSVSVVASDEYESKNIRRWQEMTGNR